MAEIITCDLLDGRSVRGLFGAPAESLAPPQPKYPPRLRRPADDQELNAFDCSRFGLEQIHCGEGGGGGSGSGRLIGSVITNVVPTPVVLLTLMLP